MNNRGGTSPIVIFILVFGLVLLAGFAGMFVYMKQTKGGNAAPVLSETKEDSEKTPETKETPAEKQLLWEAIPEKTNPPKEETEETQETDNSRYGSVLADSVYMEENRIYAKENRTEGIVRIGFVGDILFDDEYATMATLLQSGGSIEKGISGELLKIMQETDIMMINNEFPYTERGTPTPEKAYTFRANLSTINYLKDMGADIVSLANNHVYDFGEEGFYDTLTTLEEAGIPYVGAGRNIEEASAPVYFISGDIKIAIVSATQIERLDNPDTKGATADSGGTFRCWNPARLYEIVAQAKENSDFVIVYIHWGTENVEEPDWAQLQQAPELAAAGADLIIGDHPHCLQGIQYYGNTPVFYSIGNFWFNSKTLDTCIIQADISQNGLEALRFIPAIQSGCRTVPADGAERERIISYMNSISYNAVVNADGLVIKNG